MWRRKRRRAKAEEGHGRAEESAERSAGRRALFRRQGARRGAADLFLAVPRGGRFGLWLSVKRRGMRMRPEERDFLCNMTSLGYDAAVCRSRDEAEQRIHAYLVQRGEAYQKNVS